MNAREWEMPPEQRQLITVVEKRVDELMVANQTATYHSPGGLTRQKTRTTKKEEAAALTTAVKILHDLYYAAGLCLLTPSYYWMESENRVNGRPHGWPLKDRSQEGR